MGLLFAALSSLLYVVLDVLRKLLGQRLAALPVAIGLNLGALPLYVGALMVTAVGSWDGTFALVATLLAGTQAIASLLYVQAVTLSPLSLTVPYLSITPVVSALVAFMMLHEAPRLLGVVGIILVTGGALALQADEHARLRTLLLAPFSEPGSWRMLVVAILWGVTTPLNKIAIAHGSEVLLAGWITVGSAALLGMWWGLGMTEQAPTHEPVSLQTTALLALAALVVAGAVLFQLFAYKEMLVAYVETIKRFGSVLTVFLGVIVFGETGLARRLPAAAVMTLGVTCIGWR